jgi:hypothetical protein
MRSEHYNFINLTTSTATVDEIRRGRYYYSNEYLRRVRMSINIRQHLQLADTISAVYLPKLIVR